MAGTAPAGGVEPVAQGALGVVLPAQLLERGPAHPLEQRRHRADAPERLRPRERGVGHRERRLVITGQRQALGAQRVDDHDLGELADLAEVPA